MQKLIWHTEKRKVKELIPTKGNPRQMTEKQAKDLQVSLERFNLVDIPAINTDNRIISGHQRVNILKVLHHEDEMIDVRVPNRKLTEEEHREYLLRANKNTGEWDLDLLSNFDEDLLKDVGFDSMELDKIFQAEEKPEDDEAPAAPKKPVTRRGDIFQLGNHRIMCGDSTSEKDMKKLMDGTKADMVFTDPPYNVDYQGGGMNAYGQNKRSGIKNDKMSDENFKEFLYEFLKQGMNHCRGAFYICMGNSQIHTLRNAFERAGGHWQNFIIWVKHHFTITRGDYQHQYEPILYGWNGKNKSHYFIDDRTIGNVWLDLSKKAKFIGGKTVISVGGTKVEIDGKVTGRIMKGKRRIDIWNYDKPARSEEHPTMKPVAMVSEAIVNSSERGQIILDQFLGSGSTVIAAEKTERICYGIELDPQYVDVTISRWCKYAEKDQVIRNGEKITWKL